MKSPFERLLPYFSNPNQEFFGQFGLEEVFGFAVKSFASRTFPERDNKSASIYLAEERLLFLTVVKTLDSNIKFLIQ
jgi:hypothetical protein